MEHAMQTIATSGSLPMTKQPLQTEGTDARMAGNMLANEVIAYTMTTAGAWKGYAMRLITGTTDMRKVFMDAIEKGLKDMRKANAESIAASLNKDGKPDPTKDDTKLAGSRVRSATTNISWLRSIAHAWNSGASVEGLLDYAKATGRRTHATVEEVGYTVIVEYAAQFREAQAGRPADPWLVKLAKWLEKNPVPADDTQGQALAKMIGDSIAATAKAK